MDRALFHHAADLVFGQIERLRVERAIAACLLPGGFGAGAAIFGDVGKAFLERGQRAIEVLKQNENTPLSMSQEIAILFALANGHLDDVEISRVGAFEETLHRFMESNHPEILSQIQTDKAVSDETEAYLTKMLGEFKASVPY